MTQNELGELRAAWLTAVFMPARRGPAALPPCHFRDVDECEGFLQGAHWIKRNRVEEWMARQLDLPHKVTTPKWQRRQRRFNDTVELLFLAAWDPRNGVPICERHHGRFDAIQMPQIIVPREQVPARVEAFARDHGLEHELDRKHQPIGVGI